MNKVIGIILVTVLSANAGCALPTSAPPKDSTSVTYISTAGCAVGFGPWHHIRQINEPGMAGASGLRGEECQ